MILVVGGVFQGKLEFAKTLAEGPVILMGEQLALAKESCKLQKEIRQADIIADFHLYLRFLLTQERDVAQEVQKLLKQAPDVILTVAELGSGIVPMEAFDRKYRETVGRICCTLAEQAKAVYRVTCGIGLQIK